MKVKYPLVVGLGIGYYLGTRAGRERYEQIVAAARSARDSRVLEKAKAAGALGVERIRHRSRQPVQLQLLDDVPRSA
jgi:hypothetical protein